MPALQIRDLPQGTYDALKWRAESEHRSLAQEATVAIERHLQLVPGEPQMMGYERRALTEEQERQARIAKRKAIFAEIHDVLGRVEIPEDFPDPVEIIHEGRRERDARLGL
ncbi:MULTISPECIES: hypothetical protein [Atopobiaceae]|uniref:FitA-like ribbon-helix-helix domain-containing protein n=1 Tax=Atopobiaceae TaxID=1643824 RepID=UPI000B3A9B0F|nr:MULTISPECIES: hypothetical protein [Atopobiaceae]MCR8908612.1 hypothetical protein [Thermophilibacter sp. ET337]OUO32733.1 hypothetical protein B5F85_05550 [Olsenella sp. An293]